MAPSRGRIEPPGRLFGLRFLTARWPLGSNSGPFRDPAVLSWTPGRPHGQVAQLVEQRTENPRVGGSIPPLATTPNFLKRNGFPASPADYRRPRGGNRPTIGLSEIGSSIASRLSPHRTRGLRVGPPSLGSVRLRGARGRGLVLPMTASRTSPRTRAAARRVSGSGAAAPGGGAATWNSGILGTCGAAGLRGCGAAARGRFSDFQDSRFHPPRPRTRRRRRPGHGQLQGTDRERRETRV